MSDLNIKSRLKKISWLYTANARFKAFKLKYDYRKLVRYYDNLCVQQKIRYNENTAVLMFHAKHKQLRPDFMAKHAGFLKIFWVGAHRAQDETGLLQSLRRFGPHACFSNNPDNGYGPLIKSKGLNWLQVRSLNDQALIQQVTAANQAGGIDVLIGQMWAEYYSVSALKRIRKQGIPVINIAMDDRLPNLWKWRAGHRMGSVGLGQELDMVLTTCAETCTWYAAEEIPAIFWPLASDANLFEPQEKTPRDIDILFVGNRYGIRGKIVDELTKSGHKVTCYGAGWPNGPVDEEKNLWLSKRAKIILGFGTVGHCSDFYTLKLRDFDALMTGALYITHRNPDLLRIFEEGVHLECYKNSYELKQKINFYLKNPAERKRIGSWGTMHARRRHTWDDRFNQIFIQLGLLATPLGSKGKYIDQTNYDNK